jgi:hypothetical protein
MKNIVVYLILFAAAFAGCTSASRKGAVYSEWSFQCRETGLYMYEDNGRVGFGKEPASDTYLWITESTPTESIRIRNKKTGNYLQMASDGEVIAAESTEADAGALLWSYKGFTHRYKENCSWYTLSNGAGGEEKFLAAVGKEGRVEAVNRNTDFRSHWTVVRENGSRLAFVIRPDSVIEASFLGMRSSKAISPVEIVSDYHGQGGHWKLKEDISAFPQFRAENNNMLVALYNMALEEMQLNLRTDSTFATGALWPDTWTRDVVYSIYFAFSWIHKDISKKTLQKQTLSNPKEALQDTGTGGSWPISTDRVVWALAAWEYYLSTGDKDWLAEAYEGLSYTAEKDIHVAFDNNIGLFRGETCSMDWRTHTYPNWFSNENIGESFSCGTNALHLFMYDFLVKTGKLLGKDRQEIATWEKIHSMVKKGLNERFWDEEKGLYRAYLYPEFLNYRSSQRVGIMSNGLCALLGASSPEQIQSIVKNYPLYPYGGAVLYPTIPDDYAYHNKSVWAVWQTPYMYAAKRVGNTAAVEHIMKSAIRQGAMFLTHKENMTHDTGYDRNTALNSDRQLWSVASYISLIYRMIFGMEMTETGLQFSPMIPDALVNGDITLSRFPYRNALLDIRVKGTGNQVKFLTVNGEPQLLPYEFPAGKEGKYRIEIEMTTDRNATGEIHLVEAGPRKCWSPVEPVLTVENSKLIWEDAGSAYTLYSPFRKEAANSPVDISSAENGFYVVYATDKKGFESDLSNPILHSNHIALYEAEEAQYKGKKGNEAGNFSGNGYIIDFSAAPADVEFSIDLPESGTYALALVGSNGVAMHNVYCYIRSVFVNEKDYGTFILEASGNWSNWTTSNYLILKDMPAGRHSVKLRWNPENEGYDFNMSHGKRDRNDAYLDYLKVIKLK